MCRGRQRCEGSLIDSRYISILDIHINFRYTNNEFGDYLFTVLERYHIARVFILSNLMGFQIDDFSSWTMIHGAGPISDRFTSINLNVHIMIIIALKFMIASKVKSEMIALACLRLVIVKLET